VRPAPWHDRAGRILLEVIRPRVEEGLKFLVLLTKADKLNRAEGTKALSIARLQAGGGEVKLFSALKKQGVDEVAQLLFDWAHPPLPLLATASPPGGATNDDAHRMIEQFQLRPAPWHHPELPRGYGERGRPVLVFLHGFPEAAFVWDELLDHFARTRKRRLPLRGPNLRGFERSSAPADVSAYRPNTWCRTSRR
jgi:hypothetical protein